MLFTGISKDFDFVIVENRCRLCYLNRNPRALPLAKLKPFEKKKVTYSAWYSTHCLELQNKKTLVSSKV